MQARIKMAGGKGNCLVLLFKALSWYCFGIFCCLSHSASSPTHPVLRTTGWLRRLNNTPATSAEHAASNAAFTNADLTTIATTLGRFLGFHVSGHGQLQPWEVSPKFLLELVPFTRPLMLQHPSCIFSHVGTRQGRGAAWETCTAAARGRTSGSATISPGTVTLDSY